MSALCVRVCVYCLCVVCMRRVYWVVYRMWSVTQCCANARVPVCFVYMGRGGSGQGIKARICAHFTHVYSRIRMLGNFAHLRERFGHQQFMCFLKARKTVCTRRFIVSHRTHTLADLFMRVLCAYLCKEHAQTTHATLLRVDSTGEGRFGEGLSLGGKHKSS